jgi:hydroxymethylpyrimidine pyrophosphatase-like HAD family hydrolase
MVTGRELPDLKSICPYLDIFDRIVVENGALLYNPATQVERDLAPAPAPILIELLQRTGIPLSVGRTILATREPHEQTVLKVIHELGTGSGNHLQQGRCDGAAFGHQQGKRACSRRAKNWAFRRTMSSPLGRGKRPRLFAGCPGCGVAVANALPALKANASFVTKASAAPQSPN